MGAFRREHLRMRFQDDYAITQGHDETGSDQHEPVRRPPAAKPSGETPDPRSGAYPLESPIRKQPYILGESGRMASRGRRRPVRVEVWSDFVCPWCYIARSRLKRALEKYERADEVEVEWRSFQLDPTHRKGVRLGVHEMLAQKTGASLDDVRAMTDRVRSLAAEEGLTYDVERAVVVNTVDAHRLHHLSKAHGVADQVHERLMRAHFAEGEALDDLDTLVRLGVEAGVPEDEARRALTGDDHARDVKLDIRQARVYGATGVPFFVLDNTYGISGAQPVEVFLSAFRTAHEASARNAT